MRDCRCECVGKGEVEIDEGDDENEGESGGQGASNAVSEIKSGNCFVLFPWRQAMTT